MTTHGAPNPWSREAARPEDALGQALTWLPPGQQERHWPILPAPGQSAPDAVRAPAPLLPPQPPMPYAPPRGTSPMALVSLALGIASIFLFVTGPIAVGLGIAALPGTDPRTGGSPGRTQAIAGIALGAFGSLWLLVVLLLR